MVARFIGTSASDRPTVKAVPAAARLGAAERVDLSLQVLGAGEPVTQVAARQGVSRQFVYRQTAKAREALDEAFASDDADDPVGFDLPVTKAWIHQFVLAQVLIGHTSFRGVIELLDALFGYRHISLGTIHNLVAQAVVAARAINDAQDLSNIRVGAHDEIFQGG